LLIAVLALPGASSGIKTLSPLMHSPDLTHSIRRHIDLQNPAVKLHDLEVNHITELTVSFIVYTHNQPTGVLELTVLKRYIINNPFRISTAFFAPEIILLILSASSWQDISNYFWTTV